MSEITIKADTYEQALAEGLAQLGVSRDAVDVETVAPGPGDAAPPEGAIPGVTLKLKVRMEVIVARAREHLRRIMELMGIRVHLEVLNRRNGTVLNLLAPDDGALVIGKNGQTLDALQYLVNRMVMKGGRELNPVVVDSEGYKEKRTAKIEKQAMEAATRAARRQIEVKLPPMCPNDRKIVHIALRNMKGVRTLSRGSEGDRYVVVTPVAGETPSPELMRESRDRDRRDREPRRDRESRRHRRGARGRAGNRSGPGLLRERRPVQRDILPPRRDSDSNPPDPPSQPQRPDSHDEFANDLHEGFSREHRPQGSPDDRYAPPENELI